MNPKIIKAIGTITFIVICTLPFAYCAVKCEKHMGPGWSKPLGG